MACLVAPLLAADTLVFPDEKAFAVNVGLKATYNEKTVDFSIRIHTDDWAKDQYVALMMPTLTQLNELIIAKGGEKEFTDYDVLHSVKLSMFQSLFVCMKFFLIYEPDFPTRFHVVKSFLSYAIAMKITEKNFNIMVKFKDEAAMVISVILDQAKCKKFLDDSGRFDLDKTYKPEMLRQFTGQDFVKAGQIDYRAMVKGIPKHAKLSVFSHHAKGFFQSLKDLNTVSFKFMGENMKFDLPTGFGKMVESNLSDDHTDVTKVAGLVQFLKEKDFEGYDVPSEDIMFKELPKPIKPKASAE